MDNVNLEKYFNIVNLEKEKRRIQNYLPLYPMLRIKDNKLYVGIMLAKDTDNVWNKEEQIKPEYWVLINPNTDKILEFNKTSDKDFVTSNLIPKNSDNKEKEISEYTVKKTLQYRDYLINDIKNEELPIQKKLSNLLESDIEIDGEKVNINDYLFANIENDIKDKVNDLVNILIQAKYQSITFYYDNLFTQIIKEYKNEFKINKDKLKLCVEIMNSYYDGVIGIDNFFNL